MEGPSSLGRNRARGFHVGIYLTKEIVFKYTIWISYLLQFAPAFDPPIRTISGCYGNSVSLSCRDSDEVIVVHSLKVGSKPVQGPVNCSVNQPPPACCSMDEKRDCTFNYQSKVSSDKHEFRLCQGKLSECPMKVLWAQNNGKCSSAKYPSTTNYMVANYMCAKQNKVMDMCGPSGYSSIIANGTVHLRNYLYPTTGLNSRNCLCNISTPNSHKMHTLRMRAVDIFFNCSNSLVFSDQTNKAKNIACENALFGLSSVYSSKADKPSISMRYQTVNDSNMFLWVEVSVDSSNESLIQVTCRNMSEEYRMLSEIATTTNDGDSLSQGTTDTIRTSTQQISPPSSPSRFMEEKGGISVKDTKIIGGVTAGLFLAASLVIIIIYIWKRKRSGGGGAHVLRYSTDSNPYDNFNNIGHEETIYDTIPENTNRPGKTNQVGNTPDEIGQNHTYESLKGNGYARCPNRNKTGSSHASETGTGSGTSLPKESAPSPPTPDLFRRLPSIPKEENISKDGLPSETYDVINDSLSVPSKPFLESARSSTQTILETLTASDPDLSSRESLAHSGSSSIPKPEETSGNEGSAAARVDGSLTGGIGDIDQSKESQSEKSTQPTVETDDEKSSSTRVPSSPESGSKVYLPGPVKYRDSE